MKTLLVPAVTLVVSVGLLAAALIAADMFAGTWKVNPAKSTLADRWYPRTSRGMPYSVSYGRF